MFYTKIFNKKYFSLDPGYDMLPPPPPAYHDSRNFTLSPETTDCDSADLESELSVPSAGEGSYHSSGPRHSSMPILEVDYEIFFKYSNILCALTNRLLVEKGFHLKVSRECLCDRG